jgi:hypothetical protein
MLALLMEAGRAERHRHRDGAAHADVGSRRPRLADRLRRMTQAPCQHEAEQPPEQHHARHEQVEGGGEAPPVDGAPPIDAGRRRRLGPRRLARLHGGCLVRLRHDEWGEGRRVLLQRRPRQHIGQALRRILTSRGAAAGTVTVKPRISAGIASDAASTTIHAVI